MSEENKETTDDGPPTTDNPGQIKEQLKNESSNENISSPDPVAETAQTSYITDQKPTTDDGQPATVDALLKNGQPFNNESTNANSVSNDTNEAAQRETTNEKPETRIEDNHHSEFITQEMEVHHHAHASHGKKKWNEYFWEFLMLFLAVFCGFLAENIREHAIENNRAKEFSKSLLQDLQNDTTAISAERKSARLYIAVVDSLLKLSKTTLEGRNAAEFSFYTRFTYWTAPISWNRATFEQIKNSGSLRYYRNHQFLKKLLEYDALINEISSEANANSERGYILLPLINSIIEPGLHYELSKQFLATLDTMSLKTKESFFSYKTESLENKREKISELLNMIVVQQRNLRLQINTRWLRAEALATDLINDIKKEYHQE